MNIVEKAQMDYPGALDKQTEFLHFYASKKYGKYIQIFIYNFQEGRSGHCFKTNLKESIEIKFN